MSRGGLRAGVARIDAAQVMEMRTRFAMAGGPTPAELAEVYGLDRSTVYSILKGRTWRKAGGPIAKDLATGLTRPRARGLLSEHPVLASEFAMDLNPGLVVSEIALGSDRQVYWRCRSGHVWQDAVGRRARQGCGCPKCARPSLAETHPHLAAEWHHSENGELMPEDVSKGSSRIVVWLGPCGHQWSAEIGSRALQGRGCPYCANVRTAPERSLAAVVPSLAAEWHPEKNELTAWDVTPGSSRRVWWACAEGHEWQASVVARTKKLHGCPQCYQLGQRSPREMRLVAEIQALLQSMGGATRVDGATRAWHVDFADDDRRLIVEYDGHLWHSFPNRAEADRRKTLDLTKAGWRVIRVRESPLLPIGTSDVVVRTGERLPAVAAAVMKAAANAGVAGLPANDLFERYVAEGIEIAREAADQQVEGARTGRQGSPVDPIDFAARARRRRQELSTAASRNSIPRPGALGR